MMARLCSVEGFKSLPREVKAWRKYGDAAATAVLT
jgi:hypothetical protein